MTATIVTVGLLAGLAGSLLSGLAGLFAGDRSARQAAHTLLGLAAASGLAGAFAFLVSDLPPLSLGASPLFFGAMLAVDRLSAFFLLILHLVLVLATWFGARYTEDERGKYSPRVVLPLTAVFVLGMQGVLLSTGLAGFLLCWEAMSISSFFLVMADGEEDSRRAALLYLAIAQFGAGALLVGMGLLAGGNLLADFATLRETAAALTPGGARLATVLILFAFASKAGLAPLHAWLPEAHPRAPSHISALMSGVMLKVAVYGLLRFTLVCWPALGEAWGVGLLALGLGGAAVAVIYANLAREIKRILAWSSVENVGLIFAMFGFSVLLRRRGLDAQAALAESAMFLHMLAHALFKSGLFMGAGAIIRATHTAKIEALGGLASRMPQLSAAVLALALAGAALPPFGSFVAEWMLLQAALASLDAPGPLVTVTAVTILVGVAFVAGLAVFAMVRLFAFVFLAEPRSAAAASAREPDAPLRGPVGAAAVLVLALGALAPWMTPLLPVAGGMTTGSSYGLAPLAGVLGAGVTGTLPFALAVAVAAALAGAWLVQRLWRKRWPAGRSGVRRYHTWDCGQPIDATMEYTATAFSAPVRHFLRDIVRAEKHVAFRPVLPSNPWIRRGEMEFRKAAGLLERGYYPIAQLIEEVGARLKQLQNGVIQFYIALILATLLLTLWVAL